MTDSHSEPIDTWLYPTSKGLYCAAGGFYIDPPGAVERAIITHGHSDHARSGHRYVLSTIETMEIMKVRLGKEAAGSFQSLRYGEPLTIGETQVCLAPAGHVIGSAQVVIQHRGKRAVVSGDYKRSRDPTCAPFEVVSCDVFVTEATFGLPVFRHEPAEREIQRLLASIQVAADRAHLVGVYGLGKCQRVIALLREPGYDKPIWLHGALIAMCDAYRSFGIDLGPLSPASDTTCSLAGEIILCPPSALKDRWSRRMTDTVVALASGWMRVRARARQRGVELPLIISDHADWPELLQTIQDTAAEEVWVTHGREDALLHQIKLMGKCGRGLSLVGREDETD
ncbi:MAG: ligase-associated DNA damage response exonuclease [Hyphomicrobiaceae bacterium]